MANDVFVMEAANLFCGDINPGNSLHLSLSEIKLPSIEENYVDHAPGGAPVAIEVDTNIQRLESTFTLAGWQPEVMTMMRLSQQAAQVFTAYGVIRSRRTGQALEARAIIGGKLGRANPANWRRGELQHFEYSIRAFTSYELYMDNEELYNWDFFLNRLRVGGVDVNADVNSILRIANG